MATKFWKKNEPKLNKTSCLDRIVRRTNALMAHKTCFRDFQCLLLVWLKIFNNFDYFSQKSRKLPIPAVVKIRQTFKRHNFISVQDIDTNFACIVGFSGTAISNMLSTVSREPRELPWQPNLGKNEPKLNKTSCLDRIVRRTNALMADKTCFREFQCLLLG